MHFEVISDFLEHHYGGCSDQSCVRQHHGPITPVIFVCIDDFIGYTMVYYLWAITPMMNLWTETGADKDFCLV